MSTDTIARKVYESQRAHGYKGLVLETASICEQLNIEDCNQMDINSYSNKQYRQLLLQKCKQLDESRLRESATGLKKCEKIMKDKYGKKTYMSMNTIQGVRQHFYTRVKMQPFAGNYSKDPRFYKTNWMCECKLVREDEDHLISGSCPSYKDIWDNYSDLENDSELVKLEIRQY